MDAFEKWWASEVVGKPTECFPAYEETFHAGKAEGIKEGMRRAAEIAGEQPSKIVYVSAIIVDAAFSLGCAACKAAILKEAGE